MKKTEKISVLISIVLISLIAIGAVSAADDTAAADDADLAAVDEVQTVDSNQIDDDVSYESTDIIVTDTGDSGDDDVAVVEDSSKNSKSLGATQLTEGDTKTFTELQSDLSGSTAILSSDYAYVAADGDTLKNGIVIDHDLTIIGGGHTISGSDLARIFYVNSGKTLTLMGLTLVNGAAENGAAIYNDGGSITIASSKINDNTANKSGGGIYNNGGSVTITSSELKGNNLTDRTVNGDGGAAIYDNGGTVLISGSTIANNLKDIVHRGGTGTYTGDLSSAAVTTKNGALTVSECLFENNSGSYGGAILVDGANADLLVSKSTFNNNFAFNGGAIDFVGNTYAITDSTFKGNTARGTGSDKNNVATGGAISAMEHNQDCIISGCTFEDNSAANGGAIDSTNATILNCNFTNNIANSSYSETFNGKNNGRGGNGGAIRVDDGGSTSNPIDCKATIDGCKFNDNYGTGGYYGVYLRNANSEITDSSFTNTMIDLSNKGTLSISDNTYDHENSMPSEKVDIRSSDTIPITIGEGQIPVIKSGMMYYAPSGFADLQSLMNKTITGTIYLTSDVTKLASEEETFANGISVDKDITINTQGHTIAANSGKIFTVSEGKTLTLRNATLQGSGETAITNYGTVILYLADNYQFTNCGDVLIDNHGRTTETGLTTFTQLNNLIGLVNGGTVYIGESKITKAEDEKEAYKNGIVIDKDLSILGSYNTYYKYVKTSINASDDGRIFTVAEGKSLSLKYINVTNGAAEEGAGVYVSEGATLIADTANFIENIAVTKGGAIYSEGTVDLTNVTIKNNAISKTDGVMADDNGGAALYNNGGTATLDKVNVTDNQKSYVNGDIMDGVVVSKGATTITNSYFANNFGRWGGAITQTGTDKTLTVEGTTFEDNVAIFGAAIFDDSTLVVKDCKFYNNSGIGPGSPGTSNSQGAAILVMDDTGSADISGSEFINNTADCGGAVSLADVGSDCIIDDCTFIDNTANADGGAVYFWTEGAKVTVTDSEFIHNTAPYGGAIENEGIGALVVDDCEFTENTASLRGGAIISSGDTSVSNSIFTDNAASGNTNAIYLYNTDTSLSLSNNVITGSDDAQIYVKDGIDVVTPLKVKILNNETKNINMVPYDITAVVTDDKGNNIVDLAFRFTVGDEVVSGISIDAATGVYTATFTPTKTGEFVVSTNLADADEVQTGVLNIFRTLTDLKAIIDANTNGTIDLDGDYSYNALFDSALTEGITINKAIVINGNGHTICGDDKARLFKVVNGGELTLKDVTVCDGKADDGAGIYLESGAKLTATDSTFKDSTAKYSGGAIYADGAEISLTNCVLDGNDVTDYTQNNDTGGAAIYGNSATLALVNTNVTNNGNKELDRTKGDLINGVINLMNSDATVTGCVFENNTGIYGGAITTQAPAGAKTLTISESNFTANAAYTGGAVYVGDNVKFTIEDSIFDANNKATGEGSPGYTSGGGAIQIIGAQGTIDNVIIKNSIATQGGAIGVEGTAPVTIKDSTFESNTATSEGGAIYAFNYTDVTVTGCTFTNNDAPFGSAISNDGTLSLSGNTITGGSVVPIANYYGTITSPVYVTTLDGQTVTTATATNDVTAVLKDDNGNAIIDKKLVLIVNDEEVTTSYNKVTGIMTGSYTFTQPGTYEVTAKGIDAEHTTVGTLVYTAGTFTELQNLINAAEAGATITLDHDIVYNEAFDGDALKEGIVVDKAVTIVGADGIEICGNDLARVFKVANAAALTLKDITICDGLADIGGGVYVESGATLKADGVTFTKNNATTRGGAIYSEGTVDLKDSTLKENYINNRGGAGSEDKGGAALFNKGGIATLDNVQVIDNVKDYVNGHVLDGAIVAMGKTTITNSYFKGNKGRYGGAIAQTGTDETLTVTGTTFEDNEAIFGAAIYDEAGPLVVDNCKFYNNSGVGPGSPGTSSSQGGAILLMYSGASADIKDSDFINNTAEIGGAISFSEKTDGALSIDNCKFIDNKALNEGGAIYNWNTVNNLTIKDSTFTDNTAVNWGDAISNDGLLKLEGNTITGGRAAAIGNWYGTINSKVVSTILENTTYNWHTAEFLINATLTDDNGNLINDHFFKFIITYTAFRGTIEVPAAYYSDLGYYQGKFTPDKAGEYLINLGYENEEVATSVITVHKSLIDLANLIANDEDGIIDLDEDYAYIAEFDSSIINGIVIDKDVTINGAENANIINGSNLARLFKVTAGNTLTLNGVTIANAKADKGAGVYVDAGATLNANNVNFTENSAVYRGGAIYSEGTVNVDTAVFDKNDITFRTANDDNGGAAIYNLNGVLNVNHANITNSVKDIVIRDGNAGDLLVGVVVTTGETLIQNSYFANNTGSWGGAISSLGYMNNEAYTLTVENTTFEGNNATFGGAIFVESSNLVVKDSRFNNNLGVGVGSSGTSNTQGGAIVVHPAGSSATITGSNFTANSANLGGAVSLAGVDKNSLIDNCIFTDNTATSEGGAVYLWTQGDAVVSVKDSKFSGNTAPWGNAISNDGTLSLSGNTISTTSADIGNYYGSIVSPISVSILGNDTTEGSGIVTAELGQTVTITGVITDDNGNLIRDINFDYEVTNGDNIKEVHAVYNANTKQYEAEYVIENAGDHLVTITSDANTNLLINTGLYQVEKAKATLTVTVANIKKGEKAKVEVELIGADDTGLAGQPITVRVNDVDYEITTGTDGKYSFEIEDLATGRYDAVAVFAGNNNYKLAFNSTIFDVKEEPALTVSIDNIAYGEDAIVEVTLKVGDAPITGFVDVTIGEETYKVAVVDGEGIYTLTHLDVGTYTYTATFAETADYFAAGPTDAQTFTVSTADVVTDFHHRETESGEDGVLFGGIANVLRDDDGNIVYDEEGNPVPDDESYVDTEFTLIFKDEDGVEVLKLEGLSPDEDGAISLPGTGDLPIGKYTVTVVLDDNYNLLVDTFEFEVTPKSAQAGIDLGEIDITEGETTTVYITVGEGKVYAFTSYGDDDDEGPVYSTGTVLVLEEGDEWTKVVVLTNDADPSYVGREFYVESDDAFWHMKELFLDEGETGTGIYVRTHESGVVPQDIDGTATITVTNDDGFSLVITDVPITDGKGEYELPVLPLGEYYFTVSVEADGYDIEPAEFYDCLVVWIKEGTYTHLQQIINEGINDEDRYNDEDNSVWIDLDIDFAFDPDYDAALVGGVVIDSDKLVKINGNDHTISGSDLARIFSITAGTQVELMNVVLANGAVTDNGAAIYNLGELYVHDATFKDNKVTQGTVWGPGAIAAGGAAIFSYTESTLIVDNSEFLNNEALHGLYNSFTCGAIYVSGAEKVVIANSKFENNAAVLGGAITIEDYTVDEAYANSDDYEATIHDCEFNNNLAWQGGAININEKVPYLDIDFCNFNENKAVDPNSGSSVPTGGAISVGTHNYGTKLGLYHCNFDDNSALNTGGAIALMNEACELGMNECNFNDNTATKGGAIYFYGESAEIHNSYFSGNDPEYGGALYIANGDVSIDYTNFDENTATQGGAIFVAKDAGLDLDHCNFYKNTADEGSAIYADYGSSLTMKECNFDENVATGNYGTVFLGSDNAVIDQTNFNNNKGGNGGAIFWTGDNGKVTNSNFWRNEATEGFSGGAIFAFGDNIEIDNCDFNENTAAVHGGAIAWINQGAIGGHEGTIINSRVNNNKAGNSGGAIYWAGESGTVDNCEFYNNEATANGAAIISTGSDMTIKDSRFDNNKAATDGAIYFAGNDADLIGDSFTNGQATMGAIVLDGASISVDKCFFEGNNGMPVHYNILNSGTIESITDTTFRFIDPNIELGDTYTYGDEIKMTGTFDWGVQQPAITMKYTVNGVEKTTTVLNAQFTADLGDLDVGTYTVVIKSFTDDNGNTYVVNTAEKTFEVIKATPILEVEGDEYLMPGATATVGITLTGVDMEGIAGTVIVTVDGKKYVVVTDANGEGSVDIAGLANGKYPITAEFIGNDNYGTVTNDTEFIDFYYRTATFDIVIDDYTYGDVITIIVENATDVDGNPLNGMVFGNIEGAKGDGAGLAVRVENGVGTATIRKLIVDEYNVVATFTDETYEFISETKEFTFNVVKAQSAADVTYADGEFTITLDGVADEKLNESLSVLIDGVAYDAQTTVNGTITFAAPDLAVGKHTIEVAFAGNDNYLGSVDSFTFDIPKGIPTITVTGDSIDEGETATVTVTVKDGTTGVAGNAVVTVNGVDYAVTIAENGVGTVDIDGLPYGEYPIAAKFLGNDDYEAAVYDGTVKVVVESDVATFDIVIENITYGEGLVVIVENATDAAGNPLNGRVIGNIENATGQGAGLIVYVTNGKGSRTYTGLTAGDYDVVATFYDDDYEWFSKTKEFTVNVAQAEPTVGVTYADGAITITLDGVNGEKLNETVTVAIDGTPVNIAAVTENGTFTFTPTVAPGAHLVEVEFAGNHNYVAGSAYTSFEAPKLTPTITVTGDVVNFEEVATVNVTVMAGETPVAGNAVVTVNGVNYAVTIGADGKGFVDIENLPFGEYPITAKFLANDKYEEAVYSGDAKVVVNMPTDVTFDLAVDDGLTTVTVSDATNAAGEAIDGYIMGVLMKDGQKVATLDMGTLADGTGTLALPADLDAGDYTVMVTVKDGDMKLTGTDEINFTVEPKAAVVIGDADDYAFDVTGQLEINVTDVAGTPIAGTVTVVIDEGIYKEIEINGNTVIDLTGLDIGAHIVNVVFTAPNYRDSEWVGGFNVTKAAPIISVTGSEVPYGDTSTVDIKVTDQAGNPITGTVIVYASWGVDGAYDVVELAADGTGQAAFRLDLLNGPGTYDVTATYVENDKYTEAVNDTAKAIVADSTKMELEVTVPSDAEFGEDVIITITSTDETGAEVPVEKVNVTINGETQELTVGEDGKVNIGKLPAGETTVTVSVDDGKHSLATETVKVNVEPAGGAIVLAGAEDYPFTGTGNLVINVTDANDQPLNGTITIEIDGEPYKVEAINNGHLEVELKDLEIGAHTAEVIFTNGNYLDSDFIVHFNVTKATPVISVTGSSVSYGNPSTVDITVTDQAGNPITGTVIVYVSWDADGAYDVVELAADGTGQAVLRLDLLNGVGTYDVTATYVENDKYTEAVNNTEKAIVTDSTELNIEVTANEPIVGQDVIITVTGTDGSGKTVTIDQVEVTIDGKTPQNPLTIDENGQVNLGPLGPGQHDIIVNVVDGTHQPASGEVTVVVKEPTILGTNITVTVTNITYGDSETITFTLQDENGAKLTGKLNVTVGDKPYEVPVDNGVGVITLPNLNADTYPVVANFEGNVSYAPSTGTNHFNVAKKGTRIIYHNMTTTAVDFYVDGKVGNWFVWRLVDANGNPIANAPMQIGFNGVVYDKRNGMVTDENGYARLQINLMTAFTYTFAVSFLGDENHNASFVVAKIDVLKQVPTITVPNKSYKASAKTKTLTATFKSDQGTPIADKVIKFTVNGKTYSAKTDAKGVAKVNVSLTKKGTYKVTMKYAGSGTYSNVTKTATLKLT